MKTTWFTKKWMIVLLQAAGWILLFSLPYLLRPPYQSRPPHPTPESPSLRLLLSICTDPLLIIFFYLNAFILIPRFVYRKKTGTYILLQAGILVLLFLLTSGLFWLILGAGHFDLRGHILFSIFTYLFILASSTAYQMISEKIASDRRAKEKETESLKTELSLLRSQVSPHFMFNVLNNMVALARKRSEQLEPSLIKLSSLMRYMLYEADAEKVPLEKEIEYLQSYIDLQQQRYGKKVKIETRFEVLNDHCEIEPMLLIPFVENAFKHGTGLIEDACIDIELQVEKKILRFSVRNKYNADSREVKDKTAGIGLANVKRRLNLLYGDDYALLITQKDNWFVASLQISLY